MFHAVAQSYLVLCLEHPHTIYIYIILCVIERNIYIHIYIYPIYIYTQICMSGLMKCTNLLSIKKKTKTNTNDKHFEKEKLMKCLFGSRQKERIGSEVDKTIVQLRFLRANSRV